MTFRRITWGVVVLVVAGLFALSQFEELACARILTSSAVFDLLLFTPPIIWDACCRVSPRPRTRLAVISEWCVRCWLAYFWTFMITFLVLGFVTGVGPLRWSGGAFHDTMTPEVRAMYPARAFTMAVSIVVAAVVIARYDHWSASRKSGNIIG